MGQPKRTKMILRLCAILAATAALPTAWASPTLACPGGASLVPQVTTDQNQETITLAPGKPLEREIAGGEKHSYQIILAQGEYARVIVEQRGVDVVVKSFGVDGKLIADTDSENRPIGVE